MIEFYKHTYEEAILQTIKQDPNAAGAILSAKGTGRITCRICFEYEVPANYAKVVLADYIKEQVTKGAQHGTR